MKKTTDIKLNEKDVALVFRDNGKLELHLRACREEDKSVKPTNNEILAYVLSELIPINSWVEEQMNIFENLNKGNINV